MTSIVTSAHINLFRRPPEEHFASFGEIRQAAAAQRLRSRELEARDLNILFGEHGAVFFGDHCVQPTHYSLGQFAGIAKVPMAVLSRLKTATWASVLNQCFERTRRFRIGLTDGETLRAVTSDRYERVWDEELYDLVDRWLLPSGFIPAVPTINTDAQHTNALGNTKPALFRSDRDSFAFFYSEKDPRDAFGGLRKGVVVFNSEVGAIHNLKDHAGQQASKGMNPLDGAYVNGLMLSRVAKAYDAPYTTSTYVYDHIKDNLDAWVDEAVRIRNAYL